MITNLAKWIDNGRFFISLGIEDWKAKRFEFAWLWKFFAESPNVIDLEKFWFEVQTETDAMLLKHSDGNSAHAYFQKHHVTDVKNAMNQL